MGEAQAYAESVAQRKQDALRDAFAMAALTGLAGASWSKDKDMDRLAIMCFEMADAMMDARAPDPLERDRRGVTRGMRDYLARTERRRA